MRFQYIASLALAMIGFARGQQCSGVAAPLYAFAVDPAYKAIKVAGGLSGPRGIAIDKSGRLLIIQRGKGITQHTVDSAGCITASTTLLQNTKLNHAIFFSPDGTKLYASSATDAYRWSYNPTTGKLGTDMTTVVTGMNPGGHSTRTLIIPPNRPNLLVVSHGSISNLDYDSLNPAVARAIVKVFDLNSTPTGGYNYVTQGYNAGYGLRNEVGLAFDGSNMLWGVENSADDLTRTANGVTTDVHMNNPAEELNFLGDVSKPNDKWYGYPTCFTVNDGTQFKDRTFSQGDQFVLAPNSTFNDTTCVQKSKPPSLIFPAHSAPLDAKFDSNFQNLWVTLHGAWDRKPPTGFAVVRVPFTKASDGSYAPTTPINKIGYVKIFTPRSSNGPTCTSDTCVRPVGLVFDAAGRVYMTSDASGELFLISKI
ncbi:hypothetical protein SCAR479_02849 [Seiridium cardinale]|uniref:Pyrroloquinoline quinone-dependent pyranose dehydrogenase beta-propeller domain-containing protein n=1 Tax=Seiridium cardinale TaxID=138064 RepID=A0ABR2Y2A4_9PEZI